MRDNILIIITIIVIITIFNYAMGVDMRQEPKRKMSSSTDTEAILIEVDEGYSGDILI